MKFKKILLLDIDKSKLDKSYWKKLENSADKIVLSAKDDPQTQKELIETDCLLTSFGVPVSGKDIDNAPKLKYIGVLGTAYGKIDIVTAKKKGITVTNIPGYSTESVAEFVLAVILDNIRQLEKGKVLARKKIYSEKDFSATEIRNKIFGVIGAGRIGTRVAELAKGFDADVRYWSRNIKRDLEKKDIKYEDLNYLLSIADFLSINLAQTTKTEQFLDKKRIDLIKKGTIVINTAPMELVDVNALANRLKKDDITFILDHADEMKAEDLKKISKFKNCIIYPPIAYITEEARIAKQEIFIKNIENFLNGKPINVAT